MTSAMTARHHPSDAVLLADAAGALSPGLSLALDVHRALCPDCGAASVAAVAVGGALLRETAPVKLSDGAMDRVLARLDEVPFPSPVATVTPERGDLPRPLLAYRSLIRSDKWRSLGRGVRLLTLIPRGPYGGGAHLVKIAPGTPLPRHGHEGLELTVTLAGSFADEHGRYGPGDVAECDDAVDHQPVADTGAECLCLIALDGGLRLRGMVGRLISPFIRL